MFLRSQGFFGSDDHNSPDQAADRPREKTYSGWWLVLAGAGIAIIGLAFLLIFAATHVAITGHGRAQIALLLMIPIGVVLIVIGLVYALRGKPVTDDREKHADFERRNREALQQQREQRRAKRGGSGLIDKSH